MFDNLKKIQQLKALKESLEKERVEIEKEGVKVVMNGKMEIEEVKLNPELDYDRQGEILRDCFNEGVKRIHSIATQKMMQLR